MNCFAVYDETGSIYSVRYGDNQNIPNKLLGIYQEIPDEVLIDRVDVSDPENHKLIFITPKEKVLENELKEVKKV
ncbi:hypothetical protein [Clostridium sp. E02]|uniref:hypothetical protein n=1 Tax=Clostridium sp. E02 TaxID=2487134 RepID=UPI000F51D74E|nr:hypothetical protein [Clostridium sp. E02]